MAVRAIGFDLDGTLVVTERDRATLLREATEAVGAPELSRTAYRRAHREHGVAETRAPIFAALLDAGADVDPERLAAAYRERVTDSLVAVEGAEGLVRGLRSRYRVGLLTNGPRVAQAAKLSALGWEALFDAVHIGGALGVGKPDGRAFGALVDALDARPGGTAYVGDTVATDVEGAADAGLAAVQVLYPGGPDRHPRAAAAVERRALAERLPAVVEAL